MSFGYRFGGNLLASFDQISCWRSSIPDISALRIPPSSRGRDDHRVTELERSLEQTPVLTDETERRPDRHERSGPCQRLHHLFHLPRKQRQGVGPVATADVKVRFLRRTADRRAASRSSRPTSSSRSPRRPLSSRRGGRCSPSCPGSSGRGGTGRPARTASRAIGPLIASPSAPVRHAFVVGFSPPSKRTSGANRPKRSRSRSSSRARRRSYSR